MGVLPGAPKSNDTPPSSATDDPPPDAAPPQPGTDGEPTEETPATEGEPQGEPGGADENVLSKTGDAELDAALAALSPEMQQHVADMQTELARQVATGTLKPGQIPRFTELLRERHEMAQALSESNRERDAALQKAESAPAANAPGAALPEEVAALKTQGEIKARTILARDSVRALESWLRRNPSGGEINGRTVSLEEAEQKLAGWQTELDALPERSAQLQAHAAQQEQRTEISRIARQNHPWLADADHAETKAVREFLKRNPNVDELTAAALVRGFKSLNAEVVARNGKNGHGTPKPLAQKPQGKVPLGKPGAGTPGAARVVQPMERFKAVLPKAGTRVTEDHLETALANMPGRR